MEELLNKLIQRGWKPSGKECIECIKEDGPKVLDWKVIYTAVRKDKGVYHIHYSLRDVVSKESGLRQFVCENGMVKIEYGKIREKYDETSHTTDKNKIITYRQLLGEDNYEYRIIESALCNEEDLEKFLLENIKI